MKKKLSLYIIAIMLFTLFLSVPAQAAWKKTKKGMIYTTSKKPGYLKGWKTIDGERYYFNKKTGIMATGWGKIKVGKKYYRYYFGEDGKVRKGFQNIDDVMYYFDTTKGRLQLGFLTIEGKKFHADTKTGALAQNEWVDDNSGSYYFQSDCTMAVNKWVNGNWIGSDGRASGTISYKGFVRVNGKLYYYNKKKQRVTGWLTLSGKKYLLTPAVMTGWFTEGKYTYYAGKDGAVSTSTWVGKKYLTSSGAMAVGWKTLNNQRYYFDDKGNCATGSEKINGTWYRFTSDGVLLQNEWYQKGKKYYYYKADGSRAEGLTKIEDLYYFFDESTGVRQKKWIKDGNKIYYAHKSKGYLFQKRFFKKKGHRYYALGDCRLATGMNVIDGKIYGFDDDGRMYVKKFQEIDGKTYYFDKKGVAAADKWEKINKKYYYFNEKGVLQKNTVVDGYRVDANGVRQEKMKDGWVTKNGNKYYVKSGKYLTGRKKINGHYYYFDEDGVMQTGIQTVKGKKRYFYPDGTMATSITLAVGKKEYTINAKGVVTDEKTIKISGNTKGSNIAAFAIKYVGNPYVYGGTSLTKGADCSGFVQTVFKTFGINLLRVANDQMNGPSSAYIKLGYKKAVVVSTSSMRPGDLIFYGSGNYASHVAIYIGDGKIVHASNSQPYPKGGIKISPYNYQTPIKVVRYWS